MDFLTASPTYCCKLSFSPHMRNKIAKYGLPANHFVTIGSFLIIIDSNKF